jgi:hypothetical protein
MTVKLSALRTGRALLSTLSASGTNFFYRLSKPQGLVLREGLGKFQKIQNSLMGSGNRDFPVYNVGP